MSTLDQRMATLTGGNAASAAALRQLHDVVERSGGGGTARRANPAPGLETQPGLN